MYYQIVSVNPACGGYATTNATLVEGYYNTILQRASDANGKAFWISEADRMCTLGVDPKQTFFAMVNSFFMGSEYLARNRTNTEFVTDLYSSLFGRAADGDGLSFWVGQLNSGMVRDNVMDYFLFSSEFTNKMTRLSGRLGAQGNVHGVQPVRRAARGLPTPPDTSFGMAS